MKEMVIDPYLQWVDDERTAMKKMRLMSLVFVTGITYLSFATEGYPKMYYNMIGNDVPITELPIGTSALTFLLGLLIITCMSFSLASKFYERKNNMSVDTQIPRELIYFPLSLIGFIVFIILCGIIFNCLGNGQIWSVLRIMQIVFGILSPVLIISTSFQLRSNVQCIYQDSTTFVMGAFRSYYSPRSRQIHPIE
jgi:MFS family permease